MDTYSTEDEVPEYVYISDEEADEGERFTGIVERGDQTFPVTLLIVAIIIFVVLLCAAVSGAH